MNACDNICGAKKLKSAREKNGKNKKSARVNALNAKKITAPVRAALSVIGAAVGAGFITGREILSFFGGYSPAFAALSAFLLFFALFYFLLCGAVGGKLAAFGNASVYALGTLIIASMLGASDSLFYLAFGVDKNLPVGSAALLVLCTALCFTGLKGIERANVVLVPFMLLSVVFCAAYSFFCSLGENGGAGGLSNISGAGVLGAIFLPIKNGGAGLGAFGCVSYCCLNALLSQPFFIKLEREGEGIYPALTAGLAAGGLSVMIFIILLALGNKNVQTLDIPVFLLCENSSALKFLLSLAVFCAIFTTQLSTEYPLVKLAEGKRASGFYIVALAVFSFILSRLGFYVMIDVIYPIIAVFATIYYGVCGAAISAKAFFLKAPPRRTSMRQARLK